MVYTTVHQNQGKMDKQLGTNFIFFSYRVCYDYLHYRERRETCPRCPQPSKEKFIRKFNPRRNFESAVRYGLASVRRSAKDELQPNFAKQLDKKTPSYFYHCRDEEEVLFGHLTMYKQQLPWTIFREITVGGHQLNNDLTIVANIKSI